MSSTTDPNAIEINKSGVSVGGHVLRSCTRWSARHDYERGLFEVQVTLCTSQFRADLGPGSNGMFSFYPDGSVETRHFGTGGAQ